MDPALNRVLRMLDDAAEFASNFRFELTDDYLKLIDEVERLPRNQSAATKSGRWLGSPSRVRSLTAGIPQIPPRP